jgi:hypothetical protein
MPKNDPIGLGDMQAREEVAEFGKKISEIKAERKIKDIKVICASPEGRRFMWDVIVNMGGVYGASFVAGSIDITAYNEGRRAIGLKILNRLNEADKSLLQKITLEHWSEEVSNQNAKNKILEE